MYDEDEAAARTLPATLCLLIKLLFVSGSGTKQLISTSSNVAIVAGFLLCIIAILNIQIKFDKPKKQITHPLSRSPKPATAFSWSSSFTPAAFLAGRLPTRTKMTPWRVETTQWRSWPSTSSTLYFC